MSKGIIASALGGAGEGIADAGRALVGYAVKSKLQEEAADIQRRRDELLEEFAKGREGRQLESQKEVARYGDELRRKPGMDAAKEIEEKTAKPAYDEGSDSVRPQTPGERAGIEESAFRRQGLIGEAMQVRSTEQQRQRDVQSGVDRKEGHDIQREQIAATERYHKASLAIQNASEGRLAKGAKLDNDIKEITLGNLREVDSLRKEFSTTQDPERKKQITETIQLLTGKDNDNFIPVPEGYDPVTGKPTSYRIFDKKGGRFVEPNGAGAGGGTPTESDIAGLKSRSGDPRAVAYFESRFGKGAAEKYLGAPKPKPSGPGAAEKGAASSGNRGLPQVLDEQRPPKKREPFQRDEQESDFQGP